MFLCPYKYKNIRIFYYWFVSMDKLLGVLFYAFTAEFVISRKKTVQL